MKKIFKNQKVKYSTQNLAKVIKKYLLSNLLNNQQTRQYKIIYSINSNIGD
jgi:predicted GTPase